MSNFKVEVMQVDEVSDHPNAERLDIVKLVNLTYNFIVGKGSFKKGDLLVYFPLDAVIPNALAAVIGMPVKDGKDFRVKSIRLRGVWSEGVLAPLSIIGLDPKLAEVGLDLTEVLGVKKYEKPEFDGKNFRSLPEDLMALPTTVRRYDIENLQRYPSAYEALKGQRVVISEKMEGSHWWARLDKDGETVHVGQRNYEIKRGDALDVNELHPFWRTFYSEGLDDFLYALGRYYRGYDITIRGEIIGENIQGNYYGIKGREIYLFEIELNGEPVDAEVFVDLTGISALALGAPKAPRIAPLLWWHSTMSEVAPDVDTMIAKAYGKSIINPDKLREGLVIKPAREAYSPEIGRLFIKVRDAEYLAQ